MNPLTSTLADLTAAKLYQYAKDNLPPRPAIQAATLDPSKPAAYIKYMNLKQACDVVYGGTDADPIYGSNPHAVDQFGNDCNEWEQHGKAAGAPIPTFPVLTEVDLDKFSLWWSLYNLRFDVSSPLYGNDAYTDWLQDHKNFNVNAPLYPAVVIVAPAVTPSLPTAGNFLGKQVSAFPPMFAQGTSGHQLGETQSDSSGKYQLINMSPMLNDPAKFVWIKIG